MSIVKISYMSKDTAIYNKDAIRRDDMVEDYLKENKESYKFNDDEYNMSMDYWNKTMEQIYCLYPAAR